MLGLVGLVPLVLFGLWGGAVADAVDRRRLLLGSSLLLWACTGGLLVGAMTGLARLPPLLGLVAVQAAGVAGASSTRGAIVPRVLPASLVPSANTLSFTASNLGMVLGPLLAGLILARWSFAVAYAADLAIFTIALYAALRLPPIPPSGPPVTPGLRSVVEGLAFAAAGLVPSLWLMVLLLAVAGAADLVSAVYRQTILQTYAPDEMRGRMQGVFIVVVAGGPRLGDLRAGAAAAAFGATVSWVRGGLVAAALVILALPVPARRRPGRVPGPRPGLRGPDRGRGHRPHRPGPGRRRPVRQAVWQRLRRGACYGPRRRRGDQPTWTRCAGTWPAGPAGCGRRGRGERAGPVERAAPGGGGRRAAGRLPLAALGRAGGRRPPVRRPGRPAEGGRRGLDGARPRGLAGGVRRPPAHRRGRGPLGGVVPAGAVGRRRGRPGRPGGPGPRQRRLRGPLRPRVPDRRRRPLGRRDPGPARGPAGQRPGHRAAGRRRRAPPHHPAADREADGDMSLSTHVLDTARGRPAPTG